MSTIKVAHQPSNAPPGSTFMSGSTSQSNANKTNNGNGHSFPAAPHSPTKDALRPNAHPYAIKTTSTALLSRSNSSPQHNAAVQHHYIPQPPPSPVKDKPENYKYGGGRHRYSRSLTNTDLPRPLPVPIGYPSSSPTYADFASDDFAIGIQQTGGEKDHKRFGTLPTSISSPIPVASIPTELGLPSDPKLWTPSHLATFLATPFGLRGLRDAQEAKSVADFVEDKKVSGRAFLRLNEDDLERHALPPTWRLALLTSSRDLRQSQLQKRIWGSSSSSASYTNASYVHPSRTRTRSDSMSSDMSDASGHSSVSASSSKSGTGDRGRGENGRVKGMVQNFERSSSVDEGSDLSLEGPRYSRSLSPNKRTSINSNSGTGVSRSRPGSAIFPSQTGGSFPAYPKGDYIPERRGSESPEAIHSDAQWLLSASRSTESAKKEPRLLPYPPVPPVMSPANTGSAYGTFSPQVTGCEREFTPQVTGAGSFTPQATGGAFPHSQPLGPFTQTFIPQVHSYDYALASVHPASSHGDFERSGSLPNLSSLGHEYTGVEGRPLPYPPYEAQFYQPHITGNSVVSQNNQTDTEGSVAGYDTARDTDTETAGYDTAQSSADVPLRNKKQSIQYEEEPTIEELLASESGASKGAEAWELELGDTVKKISSSGRVTGRTGRQGKSTRKGVGVERMFVNEEQKGKDSKREISADVLSVPADAALEGGKAPDVVESLTPLVNETPTISEEELEQRRQEAYNLEQEMKRERERLDAMELERQRNLERERLALEEQERLESVQRKATEQEAAGTDVGVEILPRDQAQLSAPSAEQDSYDQESFEQQRQLQELELQECLLCSEISDTRRMAEELKSRLEIVEKKIEGMEKRERQCSQEHQQLSSQPPSESTSLSSFLVGAVRKTLRTVVVPILGDRTPGIVADFVGLQQNIPAPPLERRRRRDIILSKGGYVVLFSIGMCAVVLRVLLRRAAIFGGKRLGAR